MGVLSSNVDKSWIGTVSAEASSCNDIGSSGNPVELDNIPFNFQLQPVGARLK